MDSLQVRTDSLLSKPDTLLSKATLKLDSLEQSFKQTSDSLKQSYVQRKEKLSSLKLKYLSRIDSLKKGSKSKFDLNAPDSLVQASQPDVAKYTHKIDSLDNQLATVQRNTAAKLDSLKETVNNQVSKLKLPKQANGKAAQLTAGMDKVNINSFDSELASKVNLNPGGIPGLPTLTMPNEGLPDTNIPNTNVPDLNLPNSTVNIPDVKGQLPSTDLNTGQLGDVTGQAGDIQKQIKEATGSSEGLDKTIAEKAKEQLKDLPEQKLPEVAGMPGGIPKTGDEAKEQLVTMAKKEAANHFAGKESVLMGAMEKMSKYKQKYSSVNSLKDIENQKHYNELKGKPLRERLVPAITWQFQSWQDLMLDINPSVGYKFTTHFTAGLGWNQRVAFNIPQRKFSDEAKVFGIRSYGEYELKKGFAFRLDAEAMNTPIKQRSAVTDVALKRDWVWGALIGLKQKYPIYKKLKGNAQLMYNIFDKDHRSPYVDRVNFRMGFELTIKKSKSKRPEQE